MTAYTAVHRLLEDEDEEDIFALMFDRDASLERTFELCTDPNDPSTFKFQSKISIALGQDVVHNAVKLLTRTFSVEPDPTDSAAYVGRWWRQWGSEPSSDEPIFRRTVIRLLELSPEEKNQVRAAVDEYLATHI